MSSQTRIQGRRDEDRRLPPPPRAISPTLARYLSAATLHVVLTIFGFALIAFWADCGFGADTESLLFQAPLRSTTGVVTRFESTGGYQGTGTVSPNRYALATGPDVPVYAVYFSYAPVGGTRRTGVCYAPGSRQRPGVPLAEAPAPAGDFTDAKPDLPLAAGTAVVVETVAGRPGLARIRGTRTNLYEMHMLIVAVFPGAVLLLLLRGRGILRRLLRLAALGKEDTAAGLLCAPEEGETPAGPATQSVSLNEFPLNRVRVQDGMLLPPAGWAFRLCAGPLLALLCNVGYIWTHARTIFYPIRVLLNYGY